MQRSSPNSPAAIALGATAIATAPATQRCPLNSGDDGGPGVCLVRDTMNAAVRGGEEAAQAPRSEARQGGRA